MKIHLNIILLGLFIQAHTAFAQMAEEKTISTHLKTIYFKCPQKEDQFPILNLNETLVLEFDDLLGTDEDYYYKIKYFNYDWSPSVLFKNEFIEGFDNQRIDNFNSSFGTLQRYTHYRLELPNDFTQFKKTGNYLLEIYNRYDALMFSRKFLVTAPQTTVQTGVFASREIENFSTHQTVQFTITPMGINLRNPETTLKVIVLQNHQWDSQLLAPPPQYINNNQLVYRYDKETQFNGGNEYLFLDTKELRITTPNIQYVDKQEIYNTYLFTDIPRNRAGYTYYPDINGDFVVQTLQGVNPSIESDYSIVYFSLARQKVLEEGDIYIYGKFNNYELSEENKMIYNPKSEVYEGILLLKQGFYNYKYVRKTQNFLDKIGISGNYAATENDYTVLVYYRPLGALHDALIGVGQTTSFELLN